MSILYDIFARKEHPEPLLYIGSVEVDHPADITLASLEKYGPEESWLEMVAVPHQSIIVVFSEKEPVKL
jgi:hypothetical protein